MIQVLIADDHAIVRKGLRQILEETIDIVVADEAGNAADVLDKIRHSSYDVLVLDISMPGNTGLDLLKQIKSDHPDQPVLILSMHPEQQYAVRVIKAGASGYLTKESAPEQLIQAIRKIASGGKFITPSLAEKLALALETGSDKSLHDHLSDREYQVMVLIASGKTVTEIANTLFLSVKTISTYRARILEKMQMKNNAELTHYAIQHGLVD